MSQARQTEILENELTNGWTAAKITAVGAETKTVKSTAGKVARIKIVDGGITVTPVDGTIPAWDGLTSVVELDLGGTPMTFATNIKLTFDGAGSAWILYK